MANFELRISNLRSSPGGIAECGFRNADLGMRIFRRIANFEWRISNLKTHKASTLRRGGAESVLNMLSKRP